MKWNIIALTFVCPQTPSTTEERLEVAKDVEDITGFPHCLGALDGKHIEQRASGSGSYFYNYMGYHSQILMALVDAKYRFLYYDAGSNGRCNDASVFNQSSLGKLLHDGAMNFPDPAPLHPGRTEEVPYFIVGDDAFGLKPWLMKPYPFRSCTREQRIFNKRLSKARRMVECAFGHLATRFQVFGSPIRLYPQKAEQITITAVLLHNYLIDRRDRKYNATSEISYEERAFTTLWMKRHQQWNKYP